MNKTPYVQCNILSKKIKFYTHDSCNHDKMLVWCHLEVHVAATVAEGVVGLAFSQTVQHRVVLVEPVVYCTGFEKQEKLEKQSGRKIE